ncbi:polysaccharide biosynthesis tyrosine autokinase [Laspinema sp. D1]|uniref:non-specific protein-tyrosine kinase n=1 Tax=Laspinema palackyanum D2a TaxID=2953684 RepID=A0ABT2MMK3_9CYAN|nr:polysaccharide biosynthesis tyrosine autokinase [Laspinema sp. D2a]
MDNNPDFMTRENTGQKIRRQGDILDYKLPPEKSDEEKIIKELGKLVAAGKRRAFLIVIVALAFTGFNAWRISKRPPVYEGKFQILVEPVTLSENKLLRVVTQTLGDTTFGTNEGLDYESQIRVLQSPKIILPIIERIQEIYPQLTPAHITKELSTKRIMQGEEGTKIIEVSFRNRNPELVKFILETVAEGYLKYSLEERQTTIRQGMNYIKDQIPVQQADVDRLQGELESLRQRYDLINPVVEGGYLSVQAQRIGPQLIEIQSLLAERESQYATLQNLFERGNYVSILSKEAATYTFLIRDISIIDTEISAALTKYREESDTIQDLRQQKQELNLRARREALTILEKVASEVQGIQDRKELVSQDQMRYEQRLRQYPTMARQYANLEQQLQVATDSLNSLLTKRNNLQVDAAQQEIPWQIIAPPGTPSTSTTPRKTYILLTIVGLVLGLIAAFFAEIINNVFHDADDIEEETRLPILGMIPIAKELKRGAQKRKTLAPLALAGTGQRKGLDLMGESQYRQSSYISSPLLEAFRSLYTNIRLLSIHKPIHSLVIGGAIPNVGKSTIAIHLAKTAATIGQRILIVDADLRSPKIHTKLDLPNLRGLSDAISTDISLNEVIQRLPNEDNLFVLTAGSLPSDPIKLLSSKKMHSLMEQFQDFFDLVIYDTPPLMGLADGSILAAQTDGFVMVVKIDKTDRSVVVKALDGLKISGASVLGIVANGSER